MGQFQTVLITVLTGLFLFILSQFFLKFILEPMVEVRKVIGKISTHLVYYANRFSNVEDINRVNENADLKKELNEIGGKTRFLASELQGTVQLVPMYSTFAFLRLLPSLKSVDEAISSLIGLSNSLSAYPDSRSEYNKFNTDNRNTINKHLKIKGYR